MKTTGTISTDVGVDPVGNSTTLALLTAAYNGSGSLVWLRTASEGSVRPRAIASLVPSLGGKALQGEWGGTVGSPSIPGRNQVPYASSAKDIGSEKFSTAIVQRPYIVVVGEVYDHTNAADFGRTLYPIECSAERLVGEKNLSPARLADAPCAGRVVAQATVASWWPTPGQSTAVPDVIVVLYDPVNGDVHRIRRTGFDNMTLVLHLDKSYK